MIIEISSLTLPLSVYIYQNSEQIIFYKSADFTGKMIMQEIIANKK